MERTTLNVAVIGCGNISRIYLKNLSGVFGGVKVVKCCDIDPQKADKGAQTAGAKAVYDPEEVFNDPDVDLVLNLTTPGSHYEICRRALEAGKHAYTEKPLSLTFAQGKELVELAGKKGLYLGCAPDTFLGSGLQTAIKAVNDGLIGRPVAGCAFMMCPGHESWHPSPEFYYDVGGGPMLDMGPYYMTALVRLLGKAESVTAFASKAYEERTITSQPKFGQKIPVKVYTHNAGVIKFANGALVTVVMSFDVIKHRMPNIEIYGTEGTLLVPDPNTFSGKVVLSTRENRDGAELEQVSGYVDNCRGIGVAETALAIRENRLSNASAALGLHVLEIMEAFTRSADELRPVELTTTPPPMIPLDWTADAGKLKTLAK
ncbi:MAG: Gfo/Idh/MocA family oxidoreductase [Clostridia bacterium]|nr:Gfo/Idh/MocA family oxidoreductase [Clostridia bacterium]